MRPNKPLRLLIIEDNSDDADLIVHELKRAGIGVDWTRVQTEADFLAGLDEPPDLILSDYSMPQFDGLRALALIRERGLDIPFILISGTVGEELAVEAMKRGASDYILKDRTARLPQVVERVLEESRLRSVQRQTEDQARVQLSALEAAANAIVITNVRGEVEWANPAFARISGYSLEEVVGQNMRFLQSGCHKPAFYRALWKTVLAGRVWEGEIINRRKDGTLYPELMTITPVCGKDGHISGFVAIKQDFTERKRIEEELRNSEERFRQLAENIREVFWVTDPAQNEMLYISPAYELIWGQTCESLHQSPRNWLEAIHSEDRERVRQAAVAKQAQGQYDEVYRITRPDGGLRWIHDRAFPVPAADGQVYRIVGIAEDITERKKLEAQFLRAQRMESIGTLAGGIAHDLNNVLAPILVSIELLKDDVQSPDGRATLEMMLSCTQRGAELVKQVLTFARGVEGERIEIHLGHLLRDIRQVMRETFPKDIQTVLESARDLWPVLGDPTQLHQVFMNLSVNARDAMPRGGKLQLKAENVVLDEIYSGMNPDSRSGPHVVISFADTGTGIPPEIQERMFEPFFTTKETGKGTGLGLSTVMAIVRSHGGFINVYSELGSGTTFKVYLPARDQSPAVVEATVQETQLPRGQGECVLVVDDEAGIRDLTGKTLERFGYRVMTAANGAEAVALYAQHRDQIAVVLTDMAMPVMDGATTVIALKSINPAVRIICSSGLEAREGITSTLGTSIHQFIAKPYTAETILKALAQALAKPGLPPISGVSFK